ncbi:MAG: dihydrofolate reductase [Bacteroidetes bacterium]|nr:MAG: dihydrofolate reductase [Bacteroidota bacterium]REK04701.1 MAG: dihydrofolate reductase [Bacteroidota bacterium]REK36176.1 MAG: dihydrofolate reductase [Bacteroidota bacterium]REK51453.1 MAG: dihydrofolate reductase [Bacteroidota bacterium]
MKLKTLFYLALIVLAALLSCKQGEKKQEAGKEFNPVADRFADIQVLRYQIDGFDELSLSQKELAYYLYEAGLSGRDIFYDQKNRNNLRIRKTLEAVLESYKGDKDNPDWNGFLTYCKRFFFSNGIHHHYSSEKMIPECSAEYFASLVKSSDESLLPLENRSVEDFTAFITPLIFDPSIDSKGVDLSEGKDVIASSSNNFYRNVTQAEVEKFYSDKRKSDPENKAQIGFNSQLIKENGKIYEKTWKVGGMYTSAIERIVYWLEKAESVAENDAQKNTIRTLIKSYKTGDPADFDLYNIAWVKDTAARIDFVNGFIEVYQDALQKKGSYESIVSMKDMNATKRIEAISKEAQWFEDNSTIMDAHKKKNVKGISAKVITIIGEVGDAAPSTPIGINLPNNEWIREQHGSKSVSLGNIVNTYNYYRSKSPMIEEFGSSPEVIARSKKYGALAGELHTDMHEVIGHASGQINQGVGTTDETLKNYAGVLEEARADLVALYFALDSKLVQIGVMPELEVGKAEYDYYILNGLMTQLQRIQPGKNLEQAHMRNRQLVASWAYEKGKADKVIEKINRDGKTFYVINDYEKLRVLFGELLREIQRIKSEGDFNAGKNLVENYGVKVDQDILNEVHRRYAAINIAPYMGFIQPRLVPVLDGDKVKDVKVEYPEDFITQMLEYAKKYSFLPLEN